MKNRAPADSAGTKTPGRGRILTRPDYLRKLCELSVVGFVALDRSGRILDLNVSAASQLGLPAAEGTNRYFGDFLDSASIAVLNSLLQSALAGSECGKASVVLQRADGQRLEAQIEACPGERGKTCLIAITSTPERQPAQVMDSEIGVKPDWEEVSERLQQALERLAFAQRCSGAGMWDWDIRHGTVDWSSELFGLFGLNPAQHAAGFEAWQRVLHPDDRELAETGIQRAIRERTPLSSEYRVVLPTGAIRWIHALGNTRYDEHGEPVSMAGMCLDVTERKEAEGLNQRFAQIIEASSDLIAISTPEGNIEYINQAGRALLGIGPTEPLQDITVERCHPPAAYRRVVDEGLPVATANGRWLGENILLKRDGTEVPVSQNILVQRDPQTGQVIFISTVCRDTTEYHRARRALEQAELRYRIIAEFTYDWETWERPDGSLSYVSPACKRVTGYSPAEFYADPALKDSIVLEEDRNLWAAHRHRSNDVADSKVIEIRINTKDGRVVWIEHACQPVHDETGTFLGFRASNRDITERKRAEDGLRASEDRYRQQWEELHAIYESAAVGLCVLDRDLRYVRINHRLAEIHGIPAIQHLGKTPRQLLPALASKAEEIAERIFRTGEAVTDVELVAGAPSELTLPRTWIEHWRPLKDSDGHVTGITVVAEDITQRKAAEEEIKRLAFHDPLTQLANRRLLLDRLQQALATSTRNLLYGALLFIDLDNFKTLNDALGHDSGDQLLQQVAKRLVGCVRESDTIARFGGDEFVVMLKDLPHSAPPPEAQAKIVAEKILAALDQPYSLAGGEYPITPSIGITLFINHRNTVDELLKQADLAMYEAKAAGRNTYRFFDPVMQQALDTRSLLETELRAALRDHQLLLHYQPQVDGEGKVRGVEALLRWLHPRQGILLPAAFLPLAEDTGLIRPLGRWVIDTACRQLAAWAHHPEKAAWTMAINVSGRQFRHPDFADEVLAVLDHTGADPRKLKLELTESILLDDAGDAMTKMRKLKARGIGFSLDDFGTGFSSLSFLTQLPLDELKIAGTFVKDVCTSTRDAEIARIVLSLGRNLGISVIAEGVETPAQENFLARHGCKAFQGYLFGRPEPV